MAAETPFADYEILLSSHSEKLDQVLKALLDVRASLLDPKKLPASALGQFFEDQRCGSGFIETGSSISSESGSGSRSNPNPGF
jgi:hypothetical protein